jgi:hypothetical protein
MQLIKPFVMKELKDHERLKCKIVVQPSWAWSWTGNDWKRL